MEMTCVLRDRFRLGSGSLHLKFCSVPGRGSHRNIRQESNHPDILSDIEMCKADFYLQNPSVRNDELLNHVDLALVEVSTVQPMSSMMLLSDAIELRTRAQAFLAGG